MIVVLPADRKLPGRISVETLDCALAGRESVEENAISTSSAILGTTLDPSGSKATLSVPLDRVQVAAVEFHNA